MIFRLDLTIELADDLTDLGQTFFLLKRWEINTRSVRNISSIELDGEMFRIKYKRYIDEKPIIIWKGSKDYDVIMEWFKPKMRDYKLEELGI
jgi:hypothetical protein